MMRTVSVHVTFKRTIATIFRHFKDEFGGFLCEQMIAVNRTDSNVVIHETVIGQNGDGQGDLHLPNVILVRSDTEHFFTKSTSGMIRIDRYHHLHINRFFVVTNKCFKRSVARPSQG
jgi:hypothetical protein